MADQEKDENSEEQGGSGMKNIIMIAGIVIMAIAASIGGTLYFMQSEESEEVAETEEVENALPQSALYHSLRPPFIVNFVVGNKPRYLQADLTVMTRNPQVVEAVFRHTPLLRNQIIDLFVDQDYLLLQTPEGKEKLREDLLQRINEVLSGEGQEDGIESVLFTSFVMQ